MAAVPPEIMFFFNVPCPQLKERKRLKAFLIGIFRKEGQPLRRLEYIFTSDEEVLHINKRYLAHDFYTDIISFDLSDDGGTQGTIYISLERVKENSANLGFSFKEELHRVIFHGALHLCGYKDKSAADVKIMRAKEDGYLASYFSNNVPRETL